MPVLHANSTHPASFGPYLRYAIDTQFRHFKDPEQDAQIALLVELKPSVDAAQFADDIQRLPGDAKVGPAEDDAPYVSVRGSPAMLTDEGWRKLWDRCARRVTLAMPVRSQTIVPPLVMNRAFFLQRPRSRARTVIAIIDDGCAFAHPSVRRIGLGSRVFAIWDQQSRKPIEVQTPLGPRAFGRAPPDFTYGLEFWRDDAPKGIVPPPIGIDAWIQRFARPDGSVDEAGCYAQADFVSLRRRATHGAHVLDLLAGRVAPSARMSLDGVTPPSFEVATDVASGVDTDVVFVQIPQAALDDASGLWLDDHVTQGLRYIVSCLQPGATTDLIVNISYGPTTGPHNGTAMLEAYLAAMADFYDGRPGRPRLQVVLPSGNSRLSDGHLRFVSTPQKRRAEWTWRVPPDNPVPVFVELWVGAADLPGIRVALRPPGDYDGEPAVLESVVAPPDGCWLLVVPPTTGTRAALHGDWTIAVDFDVPGVVLHAYVARAAPNMGGRPGAKDARFVDTPWEARHGASATQRPGRESPAATGSLLDDAGAFSGIATGVHPSVHVAGGYQRLDRRASPYASIGPVRGGGRQGPDYALPTDISPAQRGMTGAGTLGGCTVRLVGTSAASPQLARLLAGPGAPPGCPAGQQDPVFGCGPLDPP